MSNTKIILILLGLMGAAVIITGIVVVAFIGFDLVGANAASGSQVTPTAMARASIQGLVWHDLCASGTPGQDAEAGSPGCLNGLNGAQVANGSLEAGEPGIGGVIVSLGAGACPATGLAERITDAGGRFSFDQLAAGSYCLTIDAASTHNAPVLLPGAWTSPAAPSLVMTTLSLGEAEVRQGLNFGWDYQFLPVPPTAIFTPTVTATVTTTPTPTLTPTPTSPPIPCDWVAFVKDVTVLDGTSFKPDQDFTKTWRLKNIGTCTWTKAYALVFLSGDRMTGDKVTQLKANVAPGQTVDISIELTAPVELGKSTGYWALRNPSGINFGMGPNAKDPFWVIVRVDKPKQIVYDLAENYCSASWHATLDLTCPTELYSVDGFIQRLDAPVMEEGRVENEAALWVIPEGVSGGRISGTFPAFSVKSGDRFRSVVSCSNDSPHCDVEFKLEYQIGSGEIKTLGRWTETYDGKYTKVDVDLSPLAGKDVKFILTVRAKDTFDQDSALWLHPSIWR